MAEQVKCGITGCERLYFPGKGGRGGKKPRCAMHLAREIRKSPHRNDPNPLAAGDRSAKLTVYTSEKVSAKLEQRARAEKTSPSSVAHKILSDALQVAAVTG